MHVHRPSGSEIAVSDWPSAARTATGWIPGPGDTGGHGGQSQLVHGGGTAVLEGAVEKDS